MAIAYYTFPETSQQIGLVHMIPIKSGLVVRCLKSDISDTSPGHSHGSAHLATARYVNPLVGPTTSRCSAREHQASPCGRDRCPGGVPVLLLHC